MMARQAGGARVVLALLVFLAISALAAPRASAAERYALVITGATGEDKYIQQYDEWRARLVSVLADRFGFGRDHVVALGERASGSVRVSTRENVRAAVDALAARMHSHDLLLIVLIGHGSLDGTVAKFNLVGPDLDASQWAALLKDVPGRLIVADTTGASFPFLATLAAKGRIVITATDSLAARYDTVFPEYFVKAIEQAAADAGRDGRVSVWDVFTATSAGVRRYYDQRGLLPVEHAMLDDQGDRYGKDVDQPGTDPSFAQSVYLTADAADQSTDPVTRALVERRDDLLAQIEKLKAQKSSLAPEAYESRLEKLLVELAKISRELRAKTGATKP